MAYQPGQSAKGYVMGADREWYPAGVRNAAPVPNGYGARFRRRWPIVALILGTLNAVTSTSAQYQAHPHAEWAELALFLVLSFVAGALLLGSIVCLVVALPGGSRPPPKRLISSTSGPGSSRGRTSPGASRSRSGRRSP